ncbi:hypothetical protein [Bosea sp. (in: a-proteobacteria)]|uniref:hypothetical protein n=1 Tax=Bosea sp. (in: a-proteobacteria) TaxID=1871050 RepID=UPI0040349494
MNKFSLKRHIPADVKRFVRQRDGFGCIICGSALYQYDHFETEFAEAEKHDPDDIFLLCAFDHDRKTKGILSKDSIRRAVANPKAKEMGFSFGPFDIGSVPPTVVLGDLKVTNVRTIVEVLGEPVLSVRPPETDGEPFLINACLRDANGLIILDIVENEWRTRADNWDSVVQGQRIIIRSGPGQIALTLRTQPPHELIVERMDMTDRGHRIQCQEGGKLTISSNGALIETQGGEIRDGETAIFFDGRGIGLGRRAAVTLGSGTIVAGGSSLWVPISQVAFWLRSRFAPSESGRSRV